MPSVFSIDRNLSSLESARAVDAAPSGPSSATAITIRTRTTIWVLHEVRWFAEAVLGRQRWRFQLLRAIFSWVHRFLTTAVPGRRVVVHALFTRRLGR